MSESILSVPDDNSSIIHLAAGPVELNCHFCAKPLLLWKTKSGDYVIGCPRCMGSEEHMSSLTWGRDGGDVLDDILDNPILTVGLNPDVIQAKKLHLVTKLLQHEGLHTFFKET